MSVRDTNTDTPETLSEGILGLVIPSEAKRIKIPVFHNEAFYARLRQSLDSPNGFPPLHQAIVSGDKIALACSASVKYCEDTVCGLIGYLVQHDIVPESVDLLLSEHTPIELEQLKQKVLTAEKSYRFDANAAETILQRIEVFLAPFEKDELAYLAADDDAHPIYLHRRLLDADFVLPIVQVAKPVDVSSAIVGGLVPWFCDADTCRRWNQNLILPNSNHEAKRSYADQIQWLIGPSAVVVLDGDFTREASAKVSANTEIGRMYRDAFGDSVTEGDLVLCLASDNPNADWTSIANRLYSAAQHLPTEHSKIVLVVAHLPRVNTALRQLGQATGDDSTIQNLSKSSEPTAADIATIAAILQQHSLFTYETQPRSKKEFAWESIPSIEGVQSILRTSKQAIVIG